MTQRTKSRSPFYPGQPVPVDLFAGRAAEIQRILTRGAAQVQAGKPAAFFVEGEYGIGKSSLARFTQWRAERQHKLFGLYTTLETAESPDDIGAALLQAAASESAPLGPSRSEKVMNWLAEYVGEQTIFGVTIHADALKREGPSIARGILPFLGEIHKRVREEGYEGLFLVLDEINGITALSNFAHFIKGIVDKNALSAEPLPLLLMLCGTGERRREMIQRHQPVERIFDVVHIGALTPAEMEDFFQRAFDSVSMTVEPDAMRLMVQVSAGFPKIMHLVGDNAFWIDKDSVIDHEDALQAVIGAAEEVGKKYVDQQVYKTLRSPDYHAILSKLARLGLEPRFTRKQLEQGLTEKERRKLDNFLRRMRDLNVIRQGDGRGEYVFNMRMVQLYLWLCEAQANGPART